jgi:hypothetical protein
MKILALILFFCASGYADRIPVAYESLVAAVGLRGLCAGDKMLSVKGGYASSNINAAYVTQTNNYYHMAPGANGFIEFEQPVLATNSFTLIWRGRVANIGAGDCMPLVTGDGYAPHARGVYLHFVSDPVSPFFHCVWGGDQYYPAADTNLLPQVGVWYHLALTYQYPATWHYYLDAREQLSRYGSWSTSGFEFQGSLRLGRVRPASEFLSSSSDTDYVLIYNRVLTPTEIRRDYDATKFDN